MGVIKRADIETYARDAVPLDLREMQRRADMLVEAARRHATEIVERAEAEKELLTETATGEGYQKGLKEGTRDGLERGTERGEAQALKAYSERLGALTASWEAALASWEEERSAMMTGARTSLIELAAHIAARVVKRTIELDPDVVVDQLESVIEKLVTPTDLRVRANPDDIDLLERTCAPIVTRSASCRHVEFVPDASLAPGSCVAQTDGGGEIDASVAAQLDRVVAILLPAHDGLDYDVLLEEDGDEQQDHADGSEDRAA